LRRLRGALLTALLVACGGRIKQSDSLLDESVPPASADSENQPTSVSPSNPSSGTNGDGGSSLLDSGFGASGTGGDASLSDTAECRSAASTKNSIGCDFWPVVTPSYLNNDSPLVLLVANMSTNEAHVSISGPASLTETIPGLSFKRIELKNVALLRSPQSSTVLHDELLHTGGAFHLTSSAPVSVYQFTENEGVAKSGLPRFLDGTILLSSQAVGQNYIVSEAVPGGGSAAITLSAISDSTTVTVRFGPRARSNDSPTSIAGNTVQRTLAKGDVLALKLSPIVRSKRSVSSTPMVGWVVGFIPRR